MSSIWTEKYRPKTFDDVQGQEEIVRKLRAFIQCKNLPHLLFAGPPGVGKSTLALVIARELYEDSWHSNFLELNASDERGIDIVRNKVKDFARTKSLGDAPFKLIFLDECDALTKEAQQALRRTMENYASSCRFVLAANYSSKILEPIQSRCAVFRFKPLSEKAVASLVKHVSEGEQLQLSQDTVDAVVKVAEGDLRRVVNILQSCASTEQQITPETIYSLASIAHPQELQEVLKHTMNADFITARTTLLDVMLRYGLSGIEVIKQIQKEIWNLDVEGKTKVELVAACGEMEFRMIEGSDEFIQLEALLAKFVQSTHQKTSQQ